MLRVEDIDTPRVVHGSAARITEDLVWLGLAWDEGPNGAGSNAPYTQSERVPSYDAKLASLAAAGLTYACDCSRAEISRVASAPHAGEELIYPGTCRDAPSNREMKRAPAIRLRVPVGSLVMFYDLVRGRIEQHVGESVGDFVLRRGDGVYAYQLVVAVDDAAMNVTHVVRADDLLASTARQIRTPCVSRVLSRRTAMPHGGGHADEKGRGAMGRACFGVGVERAYSGGIRERARRRGVDVALVEDGAREASA